MDVNPTERARRTALELVWQRGERRRPGPRPSLTLQAIVAATVALADADGVEAVSMQRVAERVGLTPMALYRYVGGKDALLFLALDAAAGSPPPPLAPREAWRSAVERWVRCQFDTIAAHPWMARVPVSEPPLGPNQVAWMERLLECLAQTPLTPVEQLGILNLLGGFVLGHFRLYDDLTRGARVAGMTREEAERRYMQTIGQIVDTSNFPRVAAAFAAARTDPSTDARADFEFGLARILDGVELMVIRR
jgi:AcrR family transcriptional regulator